MLNLRKSSLKLQQCFLLSVLHFSRLIVMEVVTAIFKLIKKNTQIQSISLFLAITVQVRDQVSKSYVVSFFRQSVGACELDKKFFSFILVFLFCYFILNMSKNISKKFLISLIFSSFLSMKLYLNLLFRQKVPRVLKA